MPGMILDKWVEIPGTHKHPFYLVKGLNHYLMFAVYTDDTEIVGYTDIQRYDVTDRFIGFQKMGWEVSPCQPAGFENQARCEEIGEERLAQLMKECEGGCNFPPRSILFE